MSNIIEYGRELSINNLFEMDSFSNAWTKWKKEIKKRIGGNSLSATKIFDLGDSLRDVFETTAQKGRKQSTLTTSGAAWEALVCWYLNICLIGRRTIVIKHNKDLIPSAVSDAITVNYGNFTSNTEADLIAITFPDEQEFKIDKDNIKVFDDQNKQIQCNKNGKYQYRPIMNALTEKYFTELEIHIIQCKTNWNDNSQIPMLWNAVYSAVDFNNNITVGKNGYSINQVEKFTYSFVTVPTNKLKDKNGKDRYSANSTSVMRVKNLSGGNYWGLPSKQLVASSIKEMIQKNLSGSNQPVKTTIKKSIPYLSTTYKYFDIL